MTTKAPRPESLVYGPVPSRRLGRSLGVDIVPYKVCDFDCVYCQLGRTTVHTLARAPYVAPNEVLRQVADRLRAGVRPDVITLGGSGEPTLNRALGEIVAGLKRLTDIPVALLTNGALFDDPAVRAECAGLDIILPDLDAGDEETFQRINRPCAGLTLERIVAGLEALRREFRGRIWLEVFLVAGVNDSEDAARRIAALARRIRPDRIQLNTAVRPTADASVRGVAAERMAALCGLFEPRAEIVAGFEKHATETPEISAEEVLSMLKRRPCTAQDVADGLGASLDAAAEALLLLEKARKVSAEERDGQRYYRARG